MKIKLLIFTFTFLSYTSILAQKYLINNIETRQIKVIGSAEKFVAPNEIFVGITINDRYRGKTLIPLKESEKELLKTLDSLNVNKSDIYIDDYYSENLKVSRKQIDLVKTKEYTVKLSDFKKVDFLISSLKRGNFNNCKIKRFSHTKITKYREEVKVSAVFAAMLKAKSLLDPLKANIGKVLLVEEQPYSRYTSTYANTRISANSADSDIAFKKIRLYFEIAVIFEIIDK